MHVASVGSVRVCRRGASAVPMVDLGPVSAASIVRALAVAGLLKLIILPEGYILQRVAGAGHACAWQLLLSTASLISIRVLVRPRSYGCGCGCVALSTSHRSQSAPLGPVVHSWHAVCVPLLLLHAMVGLPAVTLMLVQIVRCTWPQCQGLLCWCASLCVWCYCAGCMETDADVLLECLHACNMHP
jgi:hypothetical protein